MATARKPRGSKKPASTKPAAKTRKAAVKEEDDSAPARGRAIWRGAISFGLLNIPVELMPAERRIDLHFRLLDSRDHARVRYERVNEHTGAEVPWKDVVKAFEYDKGSYVELQEEDLRRAAPDSKESVNIEAFVDPGQVNMRYYEKPYFLVPTRKSEKGYVLLRDTLAELGQVGVARVVIRTREYLSLVVPDDDALVLFLLRYPQELIAETDYAFPGSSESGFRISPKEREMARELVKSMSAKWSPKEYRDEFRDRLGKTIRARIEEGETVGKAAPAPAEEDDAPRSDDKVIDFMSLLRKSVEAKRGGGGVKAGGSGRADSGSRARSTKTRRAS